MTHGYRDALAVPDFRRLAIALAVDSIGSWASGVVLLVYVFQQTHSATWLAVTSVVRFLPGLLLGAYSGVIAERFERTAVMIGSAFGCFLGAIGMALAVATHLPVAVVVALSVGMGVVGTPYNPAFGALMPQAVGAEHLVAANALQATIENVATVAGPSFGALLAGTGRPAAAFTLNALTFVAAAICLAGVRTRSTPTDVTEHGMGPFAQVAVGFRALGELPKVRFLVLLSVLATAVYGTDTVLFAPISKALGSDADGYGYLVTGLAVGGIAAATFVSRIAARADLTLWLGIGMAVYCLPTALIPFLHNIGVATALQVVRGIGTLIVDVLALSAVQRAVPERMLSRVLGLFDSLVFAAAAAGALLTPLILNTFGLDSTLYIFAVAPVVITLVMLPGLRRMEADAGAELARLRPRITLLGGLPLLKGANEAAIERLARAAETRQLAADSTVVREGDDADGFFVIVSGEVAVTSRGEAGTTPVAKRALHAGDYFGEIGLLYGVPRTATVRTTAPTELLFIPTDVFLATFAQAAAPSLFATAAGRLAQTHPGLAAGLESAPVTT